MSAEQATSERESSYAPPARMQQGPSMGPSVGNDTSAFALSPMSLDAGGIQTRSAFGGMPGIQLKSSSGLSSSGAEAFQQAAKSGKEGGDGLKGLQFSKTSAVQLDEKPLASDGSTGAKASSEIKADEAPSFLDKAAKLPDWDKLLKRADDLFPELDKSGLISAAARYVVTMDAANAEEQTNAARELTQELVKLNAFKTNKDGGHFWSGVKDQAADASKKQGTAEDQTSTAKKSDTVNAGNNKSMGNVLESTGGGSLFDGLSFGVSKEDWRSRLGNLWNELSRSYAKGVRGTVHIHQYVGVNTENIFSTIEWPALQELIDAGKVKDMTFYIYYNHGPRPAKGNPNRKLHHVIPNQKDLSNLVKFPLKGEPNGGYPPGLAEGAEW